MDYRLSTYAQPGAVTKIAEIKAYGQTAVICRDDRDRYWGIPSRYIENGRLVRPVNGILGNLSETYADCRANTIKTFRMEALTRRGVDPVVAVLMAVENLTLEEGLEKVRALRERANGNA